MIKKVVKSLIKLSPIPLSKNHLYDIQTKKIIRGLGENFNSIDVGCHKGEIMDIILRNSPEGTHFGIEALPSMAENLKKKYKRKANCSILNFAASNENKETAFNHVLTNPAYSGILKRDYDNPNEKDTKIKVQSKKIDDQIPNNIKINLIKIDIEGAELQALEGARKLIAKDKPIIIFEFGLGASNYYGTTPEKFIQFFNKLNMKVSNLGNYLSNAAPLSLEELERQYIEKTNYYFIAHQ